jgi:phosphatidylglycerophosphate synthase
VTMVRAAVPVRPWPWPALAAGLAGSLAVPFAVVASGWAGASTPGWSAVVQAAWGTAAALVGVLVYAVGAAAVAARWPRRVLGAANALTLLRLVIVSWLAGLLALPDPRAWQIPVVLAGLGCLVLDGVDGRVARRRGLVSAFGARFDVEVDAALMLVLSVAVAELGIAGWWVVSMGLVRYVYVGASLGWPWLRGPLFPSLARKVVGVCEVVALLAALLSPLLTGLPAAAPMALLVVALGALCWSFARDARWLYVNRAEAPRLPRTWIPRAPRTRRPVAPTAEAPAAPR